MPKNISKTSGLDKPPYPKKRWLKQETKNEIIGVAFILGGIFLLVGLISRMNHAYVLGNIGNTISYYISFLFGNVVSFMIPVLFLFWGVIFALGMRPERNLVKIIGGVLLVSSLCAILSLQCVKAGNEICMRWGGTIGAFFVYNDVLKITKSLGIVGAYLLFSGFLIISVLLSTDFLFISFFHTIVRKIKSYREEKKRSLQKEEIDFERGTGDIITTKHTSEGTDLPIFNKTRISRPRIVDNRVLKTDKEKLEKDEKEELPKFKPTQEELDLFQGYQMPSLTLLSQPLKTEYKMEENELLDISNTLEQTLRNFGITAEVVQVTQGPVITRFELQPAPGIKISRIVVLANDISMVLKAQHHVRILAPVPGKGVVGIEIPNKRRNQVFLREILSSETFLNHPSPLAMGLGKTISGEPYVCDLAAMPHLLIAGATGSGKSVCLNSIITSFLFRNSPDKLKLMLIDPKRVEFNVYQAIPHLISPVVSEPRKCAAALSWAVEHMEERYKKLVSVNVRHIDSYNQLVTNNAADSSIKPLSGSHDFMPHIVIIIDELADLMLVAKADVEENVIRLAQLSRAVGIHLIIATQRPSVNVITGIIKANFPTRIAFQVSSKVDSRTILDTNGAEALIGKGDMLFSPGGAPKPIRIQGSYVSDEEVERLVEFIKNQEKARYLKNDFTLDAKQKSKVAGFSTGGSYSSTDEGLDDRIDADLFREAVILVLENRKASVSLIQRRLKIGYARAGRLMDMMEEAGIVGENRGSKPREIIVDPVQYLINMKNEEIFDIEEKQRIEEQEEE